MAIAGLGALVESPLQRLGESLSAMPAQAAANQQTGIQQLQPYANALAKNPNLKNDPRFMNAVRTIGARFGIPVDKLLGSATPTTPATPQQGTTPTGTPGGTPSGTPAGTPSGTPSTTTPGTPDTTATGGTPGGTSENVPALTLQQKAAIEPYVKAIKTNPGVLDNPHFARAALTTAQKAGISAQQLQEIEKSLTPAGKGTPQTTPSATTTPAQTTTPDSATNVQGEGQIVPPGGGGVTPTTGGGQNTDALLSFLGVQPGGLQRFGNVQLSPDQMQTIAQAEPGEQRFAAFEMAGIDGRTVPQEILNAPKYVPPTQQAAMYKNFWQATQQLIQRGAGPSAIEAAIRSTAAADPQLANALDSDPDLVDGTKQAAQANLQNLVDIGLLKKAQADKFESDIATAATVQDVNKAHANLLGVQAQVLPAEVQAKLETAAASASRAATEAGRLQLDTNNALYGTFAQRQNLINTGLKAARAGYNQADASYRSLLAQGRAFMNKKIDPSSVMVNGISLTQQISNALAARDQAAGVLKTLGSPEFAAGIVSSAVDQSTAGDLTIGGAGKGLLPALGGTNKGTISLSVLKQNVPQGQSLSTVMQQARQNGYSIDTTK